MTRAEQLRLSLHGWAVFIEMWSNCRRKKHGAGKPGIREALFLALCCRSVANRNPMTSPHFGKLRFLFGGKPKAMTRAALQEQEEK